MYRTNILSLTYRYLCRNAAALCGVINNAGAAQKRFCSLLLLFYFSVFSTIPLSNIHVEDRSTYIVNVLDEQKNRAEAFLVFLHEMLHLHFKDRADHSLFPNSHFTEGGQGSRSVQKTQISQFAAQTIQCPDDYSSLPDNRVLHLLICGTGPKSFKGFNSFSSSLSPPTV